MRSGSDAVDGSSTGTSVPWIWGLLGLHNSEERAMTITTIGLDIAREMWIGSRTNVRSGRPSPIFAAWRPI